MNLEISLNNIATIAASKQAENQEFVLELKNLDSAWIDDQVFALNNTIEPLINCTDCGNCCNTLMINVEEEELNVAANFIDLSNTHFKEKYIEQGNSGRMILNTIPCNFLSNNKCTIYPARFGGCKEFPGLHLPNIKARLFTVMMHYDRCPIIFNVVENLKKIIN